MLIILKEIPEQSAATLRPCGRLDSVGCQDLDQALNRCESGSWKHLVLDLDETETMGSQALGVLARHQNRLITARRRLYLCTHNPLFVQAVKTTNLQRLIPLHSDAEEALSAIAKLSASPEPSA